MTEGYHKPGKRTISLLRAAKTMASFDWNDCTSAEDIVEQLNTRFRVLREAIAAEEDDPQTVSSLSAEIEGAWKALGGRADPEAPISLATAIQAEIEYERTKINVALGLPPMARVLTPTEWNDLIEDQDAKLVELREKIAMFGPSRGDLAVKLASGGPLEALRGTPPVKILQAMGNWGENELSEAQSFAYRTEDWAGPTPKCIEDLRFLRASDRVLDGFLIVLKDNKNQPCFQMPEADSYESHPNVIPIGGPLFFLDREMADAAASNDVLGESPREAFEIVPAKLVWEP
jgi:hypothetical protein